MGFTFILGGIAAKTFVLSLDYGVHTLANLQEFNFETYIPESPL
jgi:hypothetical protein